MSVETSGPLWDGRAVRAADDACRAIEKDVAQAGARMVDTNLNAVLKVQTPYYRTRVTAKPDPPGWKVTDQGVIYGPWLEGIGSRNFPKTRFRGYSTFRRTTQQLQAKAPSLADHVLIRFVPRMND